MTGNLLRAGALSCALLASTSLTAPAEAQTPRQYRFQDVNGVDLTWGDFTASVTEGSIGSGESELSLVRQGVWVGGAFDTNGHQWDGIYFNQQPIVGGGTRWTVNIGSRMEQFDAIGTLPTGSSLTGSGGAFDYRRADGTVISFGDPSGSTGPASSFCNGDPGQTTCQLLPISITSPDGKTVQITWDIWTRFTFPDPTFYARIGSVSNSYGYEIRFTYTSGGSGGGSPPTDSWYQRTGATFHNYDVVGAPSQGSTSYSYPSTGVTQVTDMGGRVWRFTGPNCDPAPGCGLGHHDDRRNAGGGDLGHQWWCYDKLFT